MDEGTVATPDYDLLLKIAKTRMPFGKYAGRYLVDLPNPTWYGFHKKAFPRGNWASCCARFTKLK